MADLIYQVAVGSASRLYDACTRSAGSYAERIGADHILQTEPILRIAPDPRTSGRSANATAKHGGFLPVFEKENAFDFLGKYDRIAIIDADVYVTPEAPSIFDQLGEADFAGVRERDMPSTPDHRKKLRAYSRMQFASLPDVDWDWQDGVADFQNMGVMLMGSRFKDYLRGETSREFLARPEFKRFVDGIGAWKWSTDQVLLNWWIRKCGMRVKSLGWEWNALYGAIKPGSAAKAHFVHFFLKDHLPGQGENVAELLKSLL